MKLSLLEYLKKEDIENGLLNKNIPYLKQAKQYRSLYVNGEEIGRDKIKNLDDLKHLTKIQKLYLTDLNISSINPLDNLKKLYFLDLSGCNSIKDFSVLTRLDKLEYLNLKRTNIKDPRIIFKLFNLPNLEELKLDKELVKSMFNFENSKDNKDKSSLFFAIQFHKNKDLGHIRKINESSDFDEIFLYNN